MNKEFIDTIIIGAGLSGIGAAYYFQRDCPNTSIAILESRDALGGTWDLFRYPGVRSDSDMFTYGFSFNPWTGPNSLATGDTLLKYLDDTAHQFGIKEKIRYGQHVKTLKWSSESASWTLEVEVNGELKLYESRYVLSCAGYYDYKQGYQPEFKNKDIFKGAFIHPQKWPTDLDYTDKKVVVIGSGATAISLVPSLAKRAQHVTMLQRSPTYIVAMPMQDVFLKFLNIFLPKAWVSRFARSRNVFFGTLFYNYMTRFPNHTKKILRKKMDKVLSKDIDRKHFTPKYNPWDQRLCLIPDDDLFHTLNSHKASIKTDKIEQITPTGIELTSGEHLDADIIVSATGLNAKLLNGIDLQVDGKSIKLGEKMFYRGILLEDVPNFGMVFGYTNASWTLKSELVSEYVCRIINHLSDTNKPICTPVDTEKVSRELFMSLTSGYVQRAQMDIPKQGSVQPWRLDQNYDKDKKRLRGVDIEDGILQFTKAKIHSNAVQKKTRAN
jgi:monooxygenase